MWDQYLALSKSITLKYFAYLCLHAIRFWETWHYYNSQPRGTTCGGHPLNFFLTDIALCYWLVINNKCNYWKYSLEQGKLSLQYIWSQILNFCGCSGISKRLAIVYFFIPICDIVILFLCTDRCFTRQCVPILYRCEYLQLTVYIISELVICIIIIKEHTTSFYLSQMLLQTQLSEQSHQTRTWHTIYFQLTWYLPVFYSHSIVQFLVTFFHVHLWFLSSHRRIYRVFLSVRGDKYNIKTINKCISYF